MSLSDIVAEYEGRGIEVRKQCGIPLTDNVICPQEAIGEVQIPLEDDMTVDMPICESHLEALVEMGKQIDLTS